MKVNENKRSAKNESSVDCLIANAQNSDALGEIIYQKKILIGYKVNEPEESLVRLQDD